MSDTPIATIKVQRDQGISMDVIITRTTPGHGYGDYHRAYMASSALGDVKFYLPISETGDKPATFDILAAAFKALADA